MLKIDDAPGIPGAPVACPIEFKMLPPEPTWELNDALVLVLHGGVRRLRSIQQTTTIRVWPRVIKLRGLTVTSSSTF